MVATILLSGLLLSLLASCSGEGNIHLLEEDVQQAMRSCITTENKENKGHQKRSVNINTSRIDNSNSEGNQYSHERRNTSDLREKIYILNATDFENDGYEAGNGGENVINSIPRPAIANRTKRSDSQVLVTKSDPDQCLSQCIFANLQVVDARGIPRESEVWTKIQNTVTSQQSRAALRDQVRACFQELQTEAEDDGCSYSNKLERCLMLRFADRKSMAKQDEKKSD